MDRPTEREHIKETIAEIESAGVTIYKLALMLGQQYTTVKHWKQTGRVESHDAKRLSEIYREVCLIHGCQIEPQYSVLKVLTIST